MLKDDACSRLIRDSEQRDSLTLKLAGELVKVHSVENVLDYLDVNGYVLPVLGEPSAYVAQIPKEDFIERLGVPLADVFRQFDDVDRILPLPEHRDSKFVVTHFKRKGEMVAQHKVH